jgi:hypothetical protein
VETLVGFAVGFVVGTREGREGLVRITEAYKAIRKQAGLKDLVGGAVGALAPLVRELTAARA